MDFIKENKILIQYFKCFYDSTVLILLANSPQLQQFFKCRKPTQYSSFNTETYF